MADFIKLPSERVEQLRTLSKNLDLSISDCITMFIREQIEKGNLPAEVPGITILAQGDTVNIDVGTFSASLTKPLANAYAAQIKAMLGPITTPAKTNPFIPELELDVARRGTSIKLIDRKSKMEKTLAPSVAKDFSDYLMQPDG